MKKFILFTVILFILFGFYHAYSVLNKDIVATNPERHISLVKDNLNQDLPEKVAVTVSDNVSASIENVESPVGLSEESLSGSLVHKLLFDRKEIAEGSFVQDSLFENLKEEDIDSEREKEIIRIYKEAPHIFDIEVLREYLLEEGYEDGYIENVCKEILSED